MTTTTNHKTGDSSNLLFAAIIGVVLVLGAALVAVMATSRNEGGAGAATGEVTITGDSLPPMEDTNPFTSKESDPAYGLVAPSLAGTDFDGNEITIEPTGRPAVIYFLAHWCGFCQAEVPVIQQLVDEGAVPEGVDIYAVSTSYQANSGGHPKLWLEGEEFTVPTMRDDDVNSALHAFGSGNFPYAVYLDQDHKVIARSTGSIPKGDMEQLWNIAADS